MVVFRPLKDADAKHWSGGFPRGRVAADGSFQLTTYEDGDGAPEGEYAVLIEWPKKGPGKDGEEMSEEDEEDRLEGAYSSADNPRFRAVVRADGNAAKDFVFTLKN
jgi:hypothetical protein